MVLSAVVAADLAASHLGALGAPAPELVRDERHFVIDVVPSVDEFHARTACGGRAVDARSGDFEGYSLALQTDSPGQLPKVSTAQPHPKARARSLMHWPASNGADLHGTHEQHENARFAYSALYTQELQDTASAPR